MFWFVEQNTLARKRQMGGVTTKMAAPVAGGLVGSARTTCILRRTAYSRSRTLFVNKRPVKVIHRRVRDKGFGYKIQEKENNKIVVTL